MVTVLSMDGELHMAKLLCASKRNPPIYLDLDDATGLKIADKPYTASPPVLDISPDRHWRVRFVIDGVSKHVIQAMGNGLCRLVVQMHYDAGHGKFPALDKHINPGAIVLVEDVVTAFQDVIHTIKLSARAQCGVIKGTVVFNTSWKAPAACPAFTKDHTPVRVKLLGLAPDNNLWFVSQLSEGFLMRGRQIQHSRPRTVAKRTPPPALTDALRSYLSTSIRLDDIDPVSDDPEKVVEAVCTRLQILSRRKPEQKEIISSSLHAILEAFWPSKEGKVPPLDGVAEPPGKRARIEPVEEDGIDGIE